MTTPALTLLVVAALGLADGPTTAPRVSATPRPFVITVVDDRTGRGVPLVELRTVNEVRHVTDSAGVAAVVEPGLEGQSVFFHVKSHGYEYSKDGFGNRGAALELSEGGSATIKVTRRNVAERLYRVIGGGIYRDTVLAGRKPPIRNPLISAKVVGSDSVLNAVYGGKLYWFWGDTNRPGYPLGNFHTPGAVSDLPGQGGLDPEVGVDLTYFTADNGFAAETAHLPGNGPTWISGLAVLAGESGRERLFGGYVKIRPPMETYERGVVEFDPAKHQFEKVATFPLDAPVRAEGHTFHGREKGGPGFIYFTTPLPLTRVRADADSVKDVTEYEAFTCLETGSRLDKGPPRIDRGPDGRARYAWRKNTPAVGPAEQAKLLREGVLKADEVLLALRDVDTAKPFLAHSGSVEWNEYRRRWVLVCVELFGSSSVLGEVWFAEADSPLGPWVYARKVVTHDKYSFYNPRQHPYFAKDGGRTIFFEGTYTVSFSGNTEPTPRYEYNQVMYKLDLADPRLDLPVPWYETAAGSLATGSANAGQGPALFFALERPGTGTVPISAGEGVTVYGLPADAKDAPKAAVPLYECVARGGRRRYVTDPARTPEGFTRSERPVALVWPSPTSVRIPAVVTGR